jgi:GAF domain
MPVALVSEIEQIVDAIGENDAEAANAALRQVAERIAQSMVVRTDEVAILAVSDHRRVLHFLFPEQLRNVGFIPLSSSHALAARTARNGRAEIINRFLDAPHASVFESVPLGREREAVIQKIMSAPIKADSRVIGVVEISRKAKTSEDSGPDFTKRDLRDLLPLTRALAKLLKFFVCD